MILYRPELIWVSRAQRQTVKTADSGRDRSDRGRTSEKLLRRLRQVVCRVFRFWSDSRPAAGLARNRPAALAIMSPGPIRDNLASVFSEAGWMLVTADCLQKSVSRQRQDPTPIIFCECESGTPTEQGAWRQTVTELSKLSPRPYIVLVSAHSDKNLWDELGRCGGSQILRVPLQRDSVICTVQAGWALWRNQQEMRHRKPEIAASS